jgi:hypothetical protein
MTEITRAPVPFSPPMESSWLYPQVWANGVMRFKKVVVGHYANGEPRHDLERYWEPDVPGEEPRAPWEDDKQ